MIQEVMSRDEAIELAMPQVQRVARRFAFDSEEFDEFVSIGHVALVKAATRFKGDWESESWLKYAYNAAKLELFHEFEKRGRTKRGGDVKTYQVSQLSRDEDADCSHSVFTDDNTPVVIVTRDEGIREAKQRISKLLELLSDDEQDVVRLRLGLDGVHGGRSYDEVCRETSRDGDAVRRDFAEACKKMRQTVRPQSKEDGSLASKFRVTPVRLAIVRAIIRSAGDWVRLHVIHKQCQEIMPFDRHTLYRDVALIEGLGEIEIHRPDRATTEVRWISIDPEVQLQAATKLYLMHLEGAAS